MFRWPWKNLTSYRHTRQAGKAKPVAFTLAAVFEFLGRRQDGVPVTFEEAQLVYSFLNQPIVACLDFLAGRDPIANPLQLIGGIAAPYDRYRQVS